MKCKTCQEHMVSQSPLQGKEPEKFDPRLTANNGTHATCTSLRMVPCQYQRIWVCFKQSFISVYGDFGDALLSVDNISAIHGFSCKLLL